MILVLVQKRFFSLKKCLRVWVNAGWGINFRVIVKDKGLNSCNRAYLSRHCFCRLKTDQNLIHGGNADDNLCK